MKTELVKSLHKNLPDIAFVLNNNRIAKDYRNVLAFFQQDESLIGCMAFNTLYNRAVFIRDLPWRKCQDQHNGTEWTDDDTEEFYRYAGDNYGLILPIDSIDIGIKMLAREHIFCPIQQYLESLQWDGKPRIATAFHDFLGVERNAYTIDISTLFFRALVARVYQPAIKFDHVIVLQGDQGISKSSFLRILGGEWYSDGIRKFEGKEAIEAIQGVLIGEIPELQGFSKAEIEEIKAFITRTEDRARMAYGRRVQSFPRRTVFVGTTNADDYLRDATGNRRFFPIICHKALDFEALAEVREQLFAEAVVHYKAAPYVPLILQGKEALEQAKLAQQAASYLDPWESVILPWLDEKIRDDYWECNAGQAYPPRDGNSVQWVMRDKVATLEIWRECLNISKEQMTDAKAKRIANIMRRAGWEHTTSRFGKRYGLAKGYLRQK